METVTVQCGDRETREINREIRQRIAEGYKEIEIAAPGARHSLGVAILEPVHLTFNGSVGYYCAGLMDGATVTIRGSAGNGAAAAMRGGTVVIQGDASARAGVSMKGGTLLIAGDSGYMTGFMAQKGTIIICGDAGEALADSMYEAAVFVGGKIA